MRISDWSSDVCSSDLRIVDHGAARRRGPGRVDRGRVAADREDRHVPARPVEILDILAFHGAAGVADIDLFALAAPRGDRREFGERELALGADGRDLASTIAYLPTDPVPATPEQNTKA